MRLLLPHGIGDCIQARPALAAFAAKQGTRLDIGTLARLPACAEVFRGEPWCSTFGVDDPWRNGPEFFEREMRVLALRHGGVLVWAHPPGDTLDPRISKRLRFAAELGLEIDPFSNPWPQPPVRSRGSFVVLHNRAGNAAKDVSVPVLRILAERHFVVPSGGWALIGDGSRRLSQEMETMSVAQGFVGVDSGPSHAASCTDTPVVWVFKTTPIEQAIPLWRDVRVVVVGPNQNRILESWSRWRDANSSLVRHLVEVVLGDPNA